MSVRIADEAAGVFADPSAYADEGLDAETSWGQELGVRYAHRDGWLNVEAIGFNTDFYDLVVAQSIGGSGTGETFSGGRVRSTGLEFQVQADPGVALDWGFRNPWYTSFTYTHSVLLSDDASGDAESLFAGGEKGNRVPYVPEYAVGFGTAFEFDNVFDYFKQISVNFDGHYVAESFTTANNVDEQVSSTGTADSRFGTTDSYVTIDTSLHLQFNRHFKLFGGAQNLFDREYVASRHPHGPRPGQPRFVYIGVELRW